MTARRRAKPPGRPSSYRADEAVKLARSGMTRPEIAKALGCDPRTVSNWLRRYPEFRRARDAGLVQRAANRHAAKAAEAANRAAVERQQLDPATRREARATARALQEAIGIPLSAASPTDALMRRQARRQASETTAEQDVEYDETNCTPVDLDDPRVADW